MRKGAFIQCLSGSGVHDRNEDCAVVFIGFCHSVSQGTGVCLVDEGFLYSPPCPYRFFGWSVGIRRLLLGHIHPGCVIWAGVGRGSTYGGCTDEGALPYELH